MADIFSTWLFAYVTGQNVRRMKPADFPGLPHVHKRTFESLQKVLRALIAVRVLEIKEMDRRANVGSQVRNVLQEG